MRKTLAGGVLVALLVLLAQPARAETWCIREAGSPGLGACVFPSGRECATAARLNPFGGICDRQPLGYGEQAEDKSASGRRSSRHKGANQH
jgi:hypothetical protein